MVMNIYITKENEHYLRSVQGSMSGYINSLIMMDRSNAKVVKEHVVAEGIKLGKIKSVPSSTPQSPEPIYASDEGQLDGIVPIADFLPASDKLIRKEEKIYNFCKHDQLKGFCKQGCV